MNTINYRKENEHEIAYTRQVYKNTHTLSNRALSHQFLKLGKFVWRDYLHRLHRLLLVVLYFIFIKIMNGDITLEARW